MTMAIKVGDLYEQDVTIELLAKWFYCRYCKGIKECHKKPHRRGYWWLGLLSANGKKYLIVDGNGEAEGLSLLGLLNELFDTSGKQIGKRKFLNAIGIVSYTTVGGWSTIYPLPTVYEINTEVEEKINKIRENEEYKLSEDDFIYIMKNLFPLKILKILGKAINLNDFKFSKEYIYLTPLLKAYRRSRTISLPFYEFKIEEISNSFTSKLTYNGNPIMFMRKRLNYDISYDIDTKTTKIEDYETHTTIELLSRELYYEIRCYDRYGVGITRINKSGQIKNLGKFNKERFLQTIGNYAIFKTERKLDPERITKVTKINGLEIIGKNIEIIQERIAGEYSDVYLYYIQSNGEEIGEKVLLVDEETLETIIIFPNCQPNNMIELFPLF